MKKIYSIIIAALILSACSTSNDVVSNKRIQKRKYTKGLNVKKTHFNLNLFDKKDNSELAINKEHKESKKKANFSYNMVKENIIASNLNSNIDLVASGKTYENNENNISDNSLNNKQLIKAIKLQKKIKKSQEIISQKIENSSTDINAIKDDEPKVHGLGLAGFITSLVGLFVSPILLGILSIIFGSIALSKIKKNPEKYKGKGFAVTALVLGIIEVVIIFLVVAILLAAI